MPAHPLGYFNLSGTTPLSMSKFLQHIVLSAGAGHYTGGNGAVMRPAVFPRTSARGAGGRSAVFPVLGRPAVLGAEQWGRGTPSSRKLTPK